MTDGRRTVAARGRLGGLQEYGLTAGEFGSTGGQTLMAALLPVLLAPTAPSATWIGAVIASEGIFAILLPYPAGALSDALPRNLARRFGRRTFFLLPAAPIMAAALALTPFRDGFWVLASMAVVFFAALHSFKTPLRSLITDSVPQGRWGRVQGVRSAVHAAGVAYGLIAGGLLFAVWRPLPFLVAAALVPLSTAVTYWAAPHPRRQGGAAVDGARERGRQKERSGRRPGSGDDAGEATAAGPGRALEFWRSLLKRPAARWFLLANLLWNAGTEGICPYLFLLAAIVIGVEVNVTSLALIPFFVSTNGGSILAGRLGDRYGRGRILLGGILLAGAAMLPGVLLRSIAPVAALLIPAALGAAALDSLSYPVFERLARGFPSGRSTGAFDLSVGAARLIGPVAIGLVIDWGGALYPELKGYPVMWPAAGVLTLLGACALWRSLTLADVEAQ